jgi:NADH dehydrogenase FAD-containing subunit
MAILLTNKKIAIVGGGPGGLTLARLLQPKVGITGIKFRAETIDGNAMFC